MPKIAPPDWIFHTLAALTAVRFIESESSLDELLELARPVLAEQYAEDATLMDDVARLCVDVLGILAELEMEDAPSLLNAFSWRVATCNEDGSPRKLRRMFGSVLDPQERAVFRVEEGMRAFRVFCFKVKNGQAPDADAPFSADRLGDAAPLFERYMLAVGFTAPGDESVST